MTLDDLYHFLSTMTIDELVELDEVIAIEVAHRFWLQRKQEVEGLERMWRGE